MSSSMIRTVPGRNHKRVEQRHGNVEAPGPEDESTAPGAAASETENEEMVITSIRATDLALGLRRLPAGFYVSVYHSGREWRTKNKPVSVDSDVVEWNGPIPMPHELSVSVCLAVQASFEFQPMLGDGEELRKLTTTVEQLLGRSAGQLAFTFRPKDGDVVSPCSSLLVTVRQRNHEESNLRVLEPHQPVAASQGLLEAAAHNGHVAMSRHQKGGERQDLEHAIEQFQHALEVCPVDNPCYAAALSNMAMVKFIYYRVYDTSASFHEPLAMYRDTLAARPVGHPDRPSTLIQLAVVHLVQFNKQQDECDAVQAETFLREAIDLSSKESHENRAATLFLQLHAGHITGAASTHHKSPVVQCSGLGATDVDMRKLGTQSLHRFERFGNLTDLQRAISCLEVSVQSTSVSDPWYHIGLANLGSAFWFRFNRLGELSDLAKAIIRQQGATNVTPNGHPDKSSRLNNLSIAFWARFRCLRQPSDLEEAISRQRDAFNVTPNDHPHRLIRLNNLSSFLVTRFEHFGDISDLEEAIAGQQDAVGLIPVGHPLKHALLSTLGGSLRIRFQRFGDMHDLEEAISRQRDTVNLTPLDHPQRLSYLNNLCSSLVTRFERLGEMVDLEEVISRQRGAVNHTPHDHPHRFSHLNNLSNSLVIRFQRLGEMCDLGEAISKQRDAVNLIPDNHPHKLALLDSLGNNFLTRFKHFGDMTDLEDAILRQQNVVNLAHDNHPQKPCYLNNLGNSFLIRFNRLGQLNDLEEGILRHRDAVDLTPGNHSHRPSHLSSLGSSFHTRFKRFGELNDLEEAILRQRDAIDLTPDGHPNKPGYLNNLGVSLETRFQRLGELSDLEEAISRQQDAVDFIPDNHPDKPVCLSGLGSSFLTRFRCLGELNDLEIGISRHQDAVYLTPGDHPEKPGRLNALGNCFITRFQRLGELSDLEEAISKQQDAIRLTPQDHPHRPRYLSNLGLSFTTRFARLGELNDLEEAISRQRDATNLIPDDDSEKPFGLSNLGSSFFTRFERFGELNDLEEAISRHRHAVDLTPDDHAHKLGYLNDLSNSYLARFKRLREPRDLEEAIARQWDAVRLTPDGRSDKPRYLGNLGHSLKTRFDHFGELGDLVEAITRQQDAVNLIPDSHPRKPAYLNNLGNSFAIRFKHLGELDDLKEAILKHWDAVNLTPNDHPDKPNYLNNLGNSFLSRFLRLGRLSDLGEAISWQQSAIHLTPGDHPDKPSRLAGLGNTFLTRFDCLGQRGDIEQAAVLYSNAACALVGPITTRFHASRQWIYCAHRLCHHSLLSAYSVAIHLLPQLAWIGLPLAHRYRELIQGSNIVREAAAAALDSGYPETAVEWLEHGRSIVWGDLFQLRSSYDELLSVHPDHARRLKELSAALEEAGANREKSLSSQVEQACGAAHNSTVSLQQEADRHRMLAIERDKLLQDIRALPGFERFLLHREYAQLRASAHSGPVVILNAAETRCDALIVLADVDRVIHVPLHNFTPGRSKEFQSVLRSVVRDARDVSSDERYGQAVEQEGPGMWKPILTPLWKCVVKPVLDALALSTSGDLSRIFWCPTGSLTFLPIHAAGFYGARFSEPGHKIFDFVVSSYVPTLSILASSPKFELAYRDGLRLLAVCQPPSDGQPKLPGVHNELDNIKTVIGNSPSPRATLVESFAGTVEEVLDLMKNADWVHFACHGAQDDANPINSGLCLADKRRLRISDIIALSRPHGGLAFLSACQTAKGDEDLSDEAVHIAAGMLFAGYGGVVGTMWSISDKLAPDIAKDIYEQLVGNGETTPDYRDAARALHFAVGRLRERDVPFKEWLPFIHLGL